LVRRWTGRRDLVTTGVATQQATAPDALRRIDLQLLAESPVKERFIVWVEAKVDSDLSGHDQLLNYARDLSARLDAGEADGGHLVFLTRPANWQKRISELWSEPDAPATLAPRCSTWPELSAALARWTTHQGPERYDTRIVAEFVHYMEEIALAEPALSLEGALVVQRFKQVDVQMDHLLSTTRARIATGRDPHDSNPKRLANGGQGAVEYGSALRVELS
jgi:hypothetical protein